MTDTTIGIYSFTCSVNGRQYVGGATRSIEGRKSTHLSNLRTGKHHSTLFQADWDNYGPDAFAFEVLEVVEAREQVPARELHWMNTLQPEYNGKYVAIGYGSKDTPERAPGKSIAYRQTISAEMFEAIEARRGALTIQEFTLFALNDALQAATIADLQRQIDELRAALSSAPQPESDEGMLTF